MSTILLILILVAIIFHVGIETLLHEVGDWFNKDK